MVGDPFSGKTSVLQVLAEAMTTLHDQGYDDENINKVKYFSRTQNTRCCSFLNYLSLFYEERFALWSLEFLFFLLRYLELMKTEDRWPLTIL